VRWDCDPENYDPQAEFAFDEPPEGCTVVPFGPFHPTLDEPAHFRLYVDGEVVRGCEYRGFMAHRGIEKLAESVLTYNEIPMAAERILRHMRLRSQRGLCAGRGAGRRVEASGAAPSISRTIMLEVERLPQPPALGGAGLSYRRIRHSFSCNPSGSASRS